LVILEMGVSQTICLGFPWRAPILLISVSQVELHAWTTKVWLNFFFSTWVWTQGLVFARKMLYHLSNSSYPNFFSL
jgi:hypothetical protein